MAKIPLTPTQYIARLNDVLQAEEGFVPGMRFYLNPEISPASASDAAWFTPFHAMGLAAAVRARVDKEFEICAPPRDCNS